VARKIFVVLLFFSLIAVPFEGVRAIPAGVGVMGDSATQPYRCIGRGDATSFTWTEVLNRVRGIDFGGEPCEPYNEAWSGERIDLNMASQTSDVIDNFQAGRIGRAIIMLGFNDLYEVAGTPDVPALLAEYRRNVERLLDAGMAPENILIIDISQENWEDKKELVDQFNAGLEDLAEEKGTAFSSFVTFQTELACRSPNGGASYNVGGQTIRNAYGDEWHNFRVADGHLGTLGNGILANDLIVNFLGVARMSDAELLAVVGGEENPSNPPPDCAPIGFPTTTTITQDSPDPSDLGATVTVNYTVTSNDGTPSGNVTVSDGVNSCSGSVATGTCNLPLTTGGARTLRATYAGNNDFRGSSDSEPHTVNKANTTTTITGDSPDASVVGQAVTVNFAVSSSAGGTPSGNVTVSDSASSATCTGTVAAGGCSITLSAAGSRTLTARYAGDTNFNSSTSAGAAHTVNPASTTTTVTGDAPDPSAFNQAVTVSFSVVANSPGGGTPGGNVTVSDGVNSCSGSVAAGSCSITLTTLGARTLTASYVGNSNYAGSSSAGAAHTVNKADTTTTITDDSPDPSEIGQSVTVQFSVTSAGGTPTGDVTVSDGVDACVGTVAAGSCSITLNTLGARTLTATYGGDTNFNGSASAGATHTVNKASTTTTITGDFPAPSTVGQAVTVNFTIISANGAPTGDVTVSDGVDACIGAVAAGSCSITLTTAGSRTLIATYAGDSNFNGSASAGAAHSVDQASTTTTITSDAPDPSVAGQAVIVNYTVAVNAPGGGTPTGNVTVSDGVDSCVGTVAAGNCSIALSTAGVRTMTATYAGDSNFTTSASAGEAHTVKDGKTLTSIAALDGWLLESGETSNKGKTLNKTASTFFLGDDAQKKQYRSVLSFTTKDLPDNAVITKITLKVKKQGVLGGGNPVNAFQGFLLDIKEGYFGLAAGLQASDFQSKGDQSYGPFKPALASGWYTFDLTPARDYINMLSTNGGVTQVRLRFKLDDNNNAKANYLSLYSGNATTASRPQLIIEYYVP
jgi:hypothetical protein